MVRGWKSDLFGLGLLEGRFPERCRAAAQQEGGGLGVALPLSFRGSQSVHCRYYRQDERGLKEAWIREVIQQSAGGLAYCHALRLIHKDLKDENIMLLQMLGCIVGGVQLKGSWSLLPVSGSQPTGRSLMCLGT